MRAPGNELVEIDVSEGVRVACRSWGTGPALLIANGLAAGSEAFLPLLGRLSPGYRFVQWDYRGLRADDGKPVDPVAHARDALRILDRLGLERAAVLGWSMGVQVALELFSLAPARVAALVLIAGAARVPWGAREEATFPGTVLPRLLSLSRRLPRRGTALARPLMAAPEAHAWARRLGFVGDDFDVETFADVMGALREVSLGKYLETLALLASHDASGVLASVDVPTLAIAGGRDPLTSRAAVERVVVGIPGAEYLVLPDATHFVPVDHADHVALRIKKFFSERGYGPQDSVAPPAPAKAPPDTP